MGNTNLAKLFLAALFTMGNSNIDNISLQANNQAKPKRVYIQVTVVLEQCQGLSERNIPYTNFIKSRSVAIDDRGIVVMDQTTDMNPDSYFSPPLILAWEVNEKTKSTPLTLDAHVTVEDRWVDTGSSDPRGEHPPQYIMLSVSSAYKDNSFAQEGKCQTDADFGRPIVTMNLSPYNPPKSKKENTNL